MSVSTAQQTIGREVTVKDWTSEFDNESLITTKRNAIRHPLSIPVSSRGDQNFSKGALFEAENLGLTGQIQDNEHRSSVKLPEVDQQVLVDKARPIGADGKCGHFLAKAQQAAMEIPD
jgi:hypothetical protein